MSFPPNLGRFDLASLRLFLFTVEAGSLTAGAERYGISLAAASKRIAELEARVGLPLLERSKRGVVATPAGQTLQRHAIELVARLEQLAVSMADFHRGTEGHLRLWANASAFMRFLPAALAAYSAAHPRIKIDLEDVFSDDAARAVARGTAELAVIDEHTLAEGLQTLVCDVDELLLVVPPRHPLAACRAVPFAQALEHEFVAFGRATSLTRQMAAAAEAAGRSLTIRVQIRSFDAMCRMVGAGLGIGLLPGAAAVPHAAAMGLRLVRIEGPLAQRRLLLAMRERGALSPPAEAFVRLVERQRLEAAREPALR
ncbi:LysR family transcriptional regulator [Caldimonas tepidiphila]|uniref:LysR family transcriptional regulator n=1 Tax=Caldimonas tepidiphila TaxID=2315841 RepID=UPI000E5AD9F2|nr:LysR family transcriptional regulator [Caldimonas tepidiphila]